MGRVKLKVLDGTVTFRENFICCSVYDVSFGEADTSITGATLNLGTNNDPVVLNIGDDLTVNSGGELNVDFGSDLTANDLILVTAGRRRP